jgi:hypothetical protein
VRGLFEGLLALAFECLHLARQFRELGMEIDLGFVRPDLRYRGFFDLRKVFCLQLLFQLAETPLIGFPLVLVIAGLVGLFLELLPVHETLRGLHGLVLRHLYGRGGQLRCGSFLRSGRFIQLVEIRACGFLRLRVEFGESDFAFVQLTDQLVVDFCLFAYGFHNILLSLGCAALSGLQYIRLSRRLMILSRGYMEPRRHGYVCRSHPSLRAQAWIGCRPGTLLQKDQLLGVSASYQPLELGCAAEHPLLKFFRSSANITIIDALAKRGSSETSEAEVVGEVGDSLQALPRQPRA